jgi:hypothetical protein
VRGHRPLPAELGIHFCCTLLVYASTKTCTRRSIDYANGHGKVQHNKRVHLAVLRPPVCVVQRRLGGEPAPSAACTIRHVLKLPLHDSSQCALRSIEYFDGYSKVQFTLHPLGTAALLAILPPPACLVQRRMDGEGTLCRRADRVDASRLVRYQRAHALQWCRGDAYIVLR